MTLALEVCAWILTFSSGAVKVLLATPPRPAMRRRVKAGS